MNNWTISVIKWDLVLTKCARLPPTPADTSVILSSVIMTFSSSSLIQGYIQMETYCNVRLFFQFRLLDIWESLSPKCPQWPNWSGRQKIFFILGHVGRNWATVNFYQSQDELDVYLFLPADDLISTTMFCWCIILTLHTQYSWLVEHDISSKT